MAFDGLFLHATARVLTPLLPLKINKIQGVSTTDTLFTLRSSNHSHKLLISAHSQYNRMHLTTKNYTSFDTPSNFIMVLRKHIEAGVIVKLEQCGLDRAFKFTIQKRNELGDFKEYAMYVELMGKYANLILVDQEGRIVDAIKRIPPFLEHARTIHPGAHFIPVQPLPKQNPFTYEQTVLSTMDFQKEFHGFSKLLATEVAYRLDHAESFAQIMQQLAQTTSLYVYECEGKAYNHIIPLTHLNCEGKTYPLMEGIDLLFDEREEKERIRQQSGDLYKVVKKELNKNKAKLPKLEQTYTKAQGGDLYREYGDLLFAYGSQIEKGARQAVLPSFSSEAMLTIALDPKRSLKENANKYYSLYHKSKTALVEMEKQIEATLQEIDYLESIQTQLEYASFQDAIEIRQELVDHHLIAPTDTRLRKSKVKAVPNFLVFEVEGIKIYVGKNNLQNDYITYTLARKNHTWFHAKDIHGSHVLVLSEQPSEPIIRAAAMLAAFYSKARHSSSVPVNYTSAKNLKKPKNRVLGQVYLQNYKTIYIDPEPELINALHEECLLKK